MNQSELKALKPKDKPYKVSVGNALNLSVYPNGSKYWRYSYRFAGKQKTLAFGVFPEVGLKEAKNKMLEARRLLREDLDPSELLSKSAKKKTHRLTASKVKGFLPTGWYHDGQGLYLQVSPRLTKSWVYRYERRGQEHRHGLGSYPDVSLKLARDLAKECRLLRIEGYDPISWKKRMRSLKMTEPAKTK